MEKFEFLEHTADVKFRARGKSLDEAFENSVLAVADFIAQSRKISEKKKKVVEIEGKDNEQLLYNLIEEILFLLDSEDFLVCSAKVEIDGKKARVEFSGDDAENYSGLDHVKSPTYAEMYVKEIGNSCSGCPMSENCGSEKFWEVQVVMDV